MRISSFFAKKPSNLMRVEIDRVVNEFLGGVHRSIFSMKGIEFKRLRPYSIIDRSTAIDDMASSRLSEDPILEPYSRVPYAEKKISIVALLDIEDAMRAPKIKEEHAAKIFWFLALSAFKYCDFLRVIPYSRLHFEDSGWLSGEDELIEFFTRYSALSSPNPRFLHFHSVYSYLNSIELRDAAVFIISDFSNSWFGNELNFKRIDILERNVKFVFFAIDEWGEFIPPARYSMAMRDYRIGSAREYSFEELYERRNAALEYFNKIEGNLRSFGALFIRIPLLDEPLLVVRRAFRRLPHLH